MAPKHSSCFGALAVSVLHMSYSLNSAKGVIWEIILRGLLRGIPKRGRQLFRIQDLEVHGGQEGSAF